MEFLWNNSPVLLRGDVSLSPRPISLHQLQALMFYDQIYNLIEFLQLHITTNVHDTLYFQTTADKLASPPDLPSPALIYFTLHPPYPLTDLLSIKFVSS